MKQIFKNIARILILAILVSLAFLSSCDEKNQSGPFCHEEFSFYLDSLPYINDWENISEDSRYIKAEASDSSGVFGINFRKDNVYPILMVEYTKRDSISYFRAIPGMFEIQSRWDNDCYIATFEGLISDNVDTLKITNGKFTWQKK